jgi:hypothetical protein
MEDQNKKEILGESLIETIADSGARDTAIDFAEIGVDQLLLKGLQDETFNQVPIIKGIYSVFKAGLAVRDYFFLRKFFLFISGFKDIDEEFKTKIDQAMSDPKYKVELGEQLVNALERFDQLSKANALFKLLVAWINQKINYQEFLQYVYVLDRINYNSLEVLKDFYLLDKAKGNNHLLNNCAFVGLLTLGGSWIHVGGFTKNEFGEKFLKILDIL